MPDRRDTPSTRRLEYLNFGLHISEGNDLTYAVHVFDSPAGEAHYTMNFPFSPGDLEKRLLEIHNTLLASGVTRRKTLLPAQQKVQDFGRTLFTALFTDQVLVCYRTSLNEASRQGKALRIQLRIDPPELAYLPWEFLYDPERDYICLSRSTSVVRYLELNEPVQPMTVTAPLRILGVIANPDGLTALDVKGEKHRVEQAMQGLKSRGLVELHWLKGQTRQDLLRELRAGPWHILHFIGHGGFDTIADEGQIILADDAGRPDPRSATDLARLLDHQTLRLVVLNICEGAKGSAHDLFSSVAATLMRRNIPAVLAMQYDISDHAALKFGRTFYETLADGYPIDTAVVEARKAILDERDTFEWVTPVLHMRAPNGLLFEIADKKSTGGSPPVQTNIPDALSRLQEAIYKFVQEKKRELTWSTFAALLLVALSVARIWWGSTAGSASLTKLFNQPPRSIPTSANQAPSTSSPTTLGTPTAPDELGRLNLQVPKNITLDGDTVVYERSTQEKIGTINGAGSYLLPSGNYYLVLPAPFVGVSKQDITVRAGTAITVDVTEGRGMLSLALSTEITLTGATFRDEASENWLGYFKGSGPFWLVPGAYSVYLGPPFVGVTLQGVAIESGSSVTPPMPANLGRILLSVPEDVSLQGNFAVIDKANQEPIGIMESAGRYWLPPGRYRVEMPSPFANLTWPDIQISAGSEIGLSAVTGLGKLTVKLPEAAALVRIRLINAQTGSDFGYTQGPGPYWGLPATYNVTLGEPAPGLDIAGVPLSATEETVIDLSSLAGTLTVSKSGTQVSSSAPPGKVVLQFPKDADPDYALVTDATTGEDQGKTSAKVPFWLATGTYTVGLSTPFVGTDRLVTVESGETVTIDAAKGLGRLVLTAIENTAIGNRMMVDRKTGREVGTAYGSGPFWVQPGEYIMKPWQPYGYYYTQILSSRVITITPDETTTIDLTTNLGSLELAVPEEMSWWGYYDIYDRASGSSVGTASGKGPFWLTPSVYTLTLPPPFIGVTWSDITIEAGKALTMYPMLGVGSLIFKVPEDILLSDTKIIDQSSGLSLGLVQGMGPFWLAPGTYTIEPGPPILGVRKTDVVIKKDVESVLDFR